LASIVAALAFGGGMLRAPTPVLPLAAQRYDAARGLLAQPRMVAFPSFGGDSSSSSSGPSEEVLACYRLMGLSEDAVYDEIEAAFESLSEQYAGDTKKKIKLQVAKDKILEDRLRQVMRGKLKGAAPINPFEREEGPKPLIKIPVFLADVMELPEKETAVKNLFVFGLIGLLPALSKSWASTSITLGFGVGLYLLYNRGIPDSGEMGADMRPPKPKPLLMAGGITLLAGMVGGTISTLVYKLMRRLVSQELCIGLFTSLGFFTAATLFKVQDEY